MDTKFQVSNMCCEICIQKLYMILQFVGQFDPYRQLFKSNCTEPK